MESNEPSTVISDWDQPFTDEELQAIDAAFQAVSSSSSSSSIKRPDAGNSTADCGDRRPRTRRRLPGSLEESSRKPPIAEKKSRSRELKWLKNLHVPSLQATTTLQYPELSFQGKIVYSRTASEVDKASKELLKFVQAKKREGGQIVLGFDIEWKPSFRRGVLPGKAAVMQICGDANHCHVMHIIHSGIPPSLRSLLEDPSSIKVGVCVGGDALKVHQDHKVSVEALEDLSSLANQKLSGKPKRWSLGSLSEMLICKKLPKPPRIRLGNWEAAVLSKAQLQYAATDAFASWYIYEVLKKFPDLPSNKSEELEETVAQQQTLADGPAVCNISD